MACVIDSSGISSLPVVNKQHADIELDSSIIFSRGKTSATLRVDKTWRGSMLLSHGAILHSIANAVVLNSDSMNLAVCKKCCLHNESPISISRTERGYQNASIDLYDFYLTAKCTSSRLQLVVSGVYNTHPPLQLQARNNSKPQKKALVTRKQRAIAMSTLASTLTADSHFLSWRYYFVTDCCLTGVEPSIVVRLLEASESYPDNVAYDLISTALLGAKTLIPGILSACIIRIAPCPGLFPEVTILPTGVKRWCLTISLYASVEYAEKAVKLVQTFVENYSYYFIQEPNGVCCNAVFTSW